MITQLIHVTWFLGLNWLLILRRKQKAAHPAAHSEQGCRPLVYMNNLMTLQPSLCELYLIWHVVL